MTRVMIAVDGTDLDARLAEAAHGLFGQDAEYWAVNVHDSSDRAPSGVVHAVPGLYAGAFVAYGAAYPFTLPRHDDAGGGSAGLDDDLASSRRAAARAAADSAGIQDAAVLTESGDPPTAILSAARRHAADVIVVGSRDRSWWSKLAESSVSDDVIDESAVPVLVISEQS
jgi:nucleotide-binding universal stress UspA family protein